MPASTLAARGLPAALKALLGNNFNVFPLGGTNGGVIVRQKGGVAGTDEVQISHTGTDAIWDNRDTGGQTLLARSGGGFTGRIDNTGSLVTNNLLYLTNNIDTGIARLAAGVAGMTSWLQQTGGRTRVITSDFTESAAALTNLTGMTQTHITGRVYTGRLVFKCGESTAADGIKIDLNGGTATYSTVWFGIVLAGGGLTDTIGVDTSTALATAVTATTITGEQIIEVPYYLVCSGTGTFIPRAAQNSHSTGTLTIRIGSHAWSEDTP